MFLSIPKNCFSEIASLFNPGLIGEENRKFDRGTTNAETRTRLPARL
jgi:hypothetical protein